MGTVVGGHAGVLVEAIIPDVGADGPLRHEAVAPHRRGGAGVDLERDVRCARVRDEGREVALPARFGTDIGQQPTSGPRERRKRPFQGLADRWAAGADEAAPQLTALTAPQAGDRKSTRLNCSHGYISYAGFSFKQKSPTPYTPPARRRLASSTTRR